MKNTNDKLVQLEVELEKLEALFNKGVLCAADVRPLNGASKSSLWRLCLTSCARKMHCCFVRIDPPESCSYKSLQR